MAMLGGLRRLRVSWPQLPSLVAAVGTGGLPAAAPAAAFRTQGGGPARPPPHSAAEEGKQWVSVRSLASSTATRGPHAGSNSPTGGDGGGSKGTAAPAGGEKQNPPAVDVDHMGEGEEGEEEDDEYGAEEGVRMAFDQLITAAYDMLAQGKPMEAEYLLAEGGCCSSTSACLLPRWPAHRPRSRGRRIRRHDPAASDAGDDGSNMPGEVADAPPADAAAAAALAPPQAPSRRRRCWGRTPWSWRLSMTSSASCCSCMNGSRTRRMQPSAQWRSSRLVPWGRWSAGA